MRRLLIALAILPLFLVSPIVGVVALGLVCVASVPHVIAWALRRTADGAEFVGEGVMAGATLVYKGQDKVVAYREGLLESYKTLSVEALAEKEARYEAAKAEEAACTEAQPQAACG